MVQVLQLKGRNCLKIQLFAVYNKCTSNIKRQVKNETLEKDVALLAGKEGFRTRNITSGKKGHFTIMGLIPEEDTMINVCT